jgi:hypothetical protein
MGKTEVTAFEDRLSTVIARVFHELWRARHLHPPFNSAHEGYAVLLEEVDELWDEVKTGGSGMEEEAVQVAAMAIAFLVDCFGDRVEWPVDGTPPRMPVPGREVCE